MWWQVIKRYTFPKPILSALRQVRVRAETHPPLGGKPCARGCRQQKGPIARHGDRPSKNSPPPRRDLHGYDR